MLIRMNQLLLFSICALVTSINVIFYVKNNCTPLDLIQSNSVQNNVNELDFNRFDNITGYPSLIVPNIVHYILFDVKEIEFVLYVSILSVLKNQKPDIIYIHCDCDQLYGQFYQKVIEKVKQTKTVFKIRKIERPTEIFGIPLSKPWLNWHASDITRIRVLMEFGGIYLDRDMYVCKSLDVFRKFEMTLDWDYGQPLGTQILICHKNARFLTEWLDSYHFYDSTQWYYNAGHYPTNNILKKHPEYIHRVIESFGVMNAPTYCPKIYSFYYPNWRKEYYSFHLLIRGNEISYKDLCFGNNKPKIMIFDENIAQSLEVTFGEMYRDLFIE